MKHFQSIQALSQLPDNHASKPIIRECLSHYLHPGYQPEHDGWILLVEFLDSYEQIFNGQTLINFKYEAVSLRQGHYVCSYVPNNQFVLTIILECDDWMDYELKEYLDEHLDI